MSDMHTLPFRPVHTVAGQDFSVSPPVLAELVTEADPELASGAGAEPAAKGSWWSRWASRPPVRRTISILAALASGWDWCFGVVSLLVGLAVLATIPVVQFLSLGYLLEVSGRVARSGRLRDGFVGIRKASRAGGLVAGVWLLALPLRFASSMWVSARLIDPASPQTKAWHAGLIALSAALILHALGAALRGGRLRQFLLPRPIRELRLILRPSVFRQARDAVWQFTAGLRLPYYFWLGLRGFFGTLAWLFVPVTLLAVASRLPEGVNFLTGMFGGLLLAVVLMHLPFLQARFAATNRLGAIFNVRAVRNQFRRAPIAFWVALFFTLLLALPLYLLKIEIIPREAAWLPSLVFVLSILPARFLAGWAASRAARREQMRHWFFRWSARFGMIPVVGIYVLIVYFTQYLSWYGRWSLYEQHAFLLPAPFL